MANQLVRPTVMLIENSYYLGDQMVVSGELTVSNISIGNARCMVTYRLTDIYNNTYLTPALVYQN